MAIKDTNETAVGLARHAQVSTVGVLDRRQAMPTPTQTKEVNQNSATRCDDNNAALSFRVYLHASSPTLHAGDSIDETIALASLNLLGCHWRLKHIAHGDSCTKPSGPKGTGQTAGERARQRCVPRLLGGWSLVGYAQQATRPCVGLGDSC